MKFKKYLVIFVFLLLIVLPSVTFAANFEYKLLESIPGFANAGEYYSFNNYISFIYKFAIWVVGICALLMISIGAFMYLTSAGNNAAMANAKQVIANAIIGLILALVAYLLLYTINPDLVSPKGVQPSTSTTTSSNYSNTNAGVSGTLSGIPTQVANQNDDASQLLLNTLSCMWNNKPEGKSFTISSISDNNCGVEGYVGERANWPQCGYEGQSNCCYHKENSCHYGGTSCKGKSYAADISIKGSSLSPSEITRLAKSCGANDPIKEGDHVHFSVGNCNCA